jgi:hypothetical protein
MELGLMEIFGNSYLISDLRCWSIWVEGHMSVVENSTPCGIGSNSVLFTSTLLSTVTLFCDLIGNFRGGWIIRFCPITSFILETKPELES